MSDAINLYINIISKPNIYLYLKEFGVFYGVKINNARGKNLQNQDFDCNQTYIY